MTPDGPGRNGVGDDGGGRTDDRSPRKEHPLVADRLVGTNRQFAAAKPSVAAGWDLGADLDKAPGEVPELAEVAVPDELRAEIEAAMHKYPDRHSAVMPALQAAQRRYGYLSPEAMRQVAAVMKVTPAYLSSIASFYDMLNEEPVGRHYIYVCTSVACHLTNAKRVFDAVEETARALDLEDTEVREFECLGACDMAPVASVDGRYVGPLHPSDAPEVVCAVKEGRRALPGRGLEDEDYRPVWEGDPPPQEQAPTEEARHIAPEEDRRRAQEPGDEQAESEEDGGSQQPRRPSLPPNAPPSRPDAATSSGEEDA